MEEARAVLDRLDRIERLDGAGAPPGELLAELRLLLDEATAWSRADGGGEEVVERLRAAMPDDIVSE